MQDGNVSSMNLSASTFWETEKRLLETELARIFEFIERRSDGFQGAKSLHINLTQRGASVICEPADVSDRNSPQLSPDMISLYNHILPFKSTETYFS